MKKLFATPWWVFVAGAAGIAFAYWYFFVRKTNPDPTNTGTATSAGQPGFSTITDT